MSSFMPSTTSVSSVPLCETVSSLRLCVQKTQREKTKKKTNRGCAIGLCSVYDAACAAVGVLFHNHLLAVADVDALLSGLVHACTLQVVINSVALVVVDGGNAIFHILGDGVNEVEVNHI